MTISVITQAIFLKLFQVQSFFTRSQSSEKVAIAFFNRKVIFNHLSDISFGHYYNVRVMGINLGDYNFFSVLVGILLTWKVISKINLWVTFQKIVYKCIICYQFLPIWPLGTFAIQKSFIFTEVNCWKISRLLRSLNWNHHLIQC